MEFEQLKKKLLLEAHNHFVAVANARPYVEFGNFVESLRRDDNTALIESIQEGVLAIIEGAFRRENDPNDELMKLAEQATPEQVNAAIEKGDNSTLLQLLYPFIIQIIDARNIKDTNMADKIFDIAIGRLETVIPKLEPVPENTSPSKWLYNFANKFIIGSTIKDQMSPSKRGPVQKEIVPGEEGNASQYWEYVDKSKRVGGKKYGKAIQHKADPTTREDMIKIKWKGIKNRSGGWAEKPITEWVPADQVQAYDLKNHNTYALSMDAGSKDVNDKQTLGDTIEGGIEANVPDGATVILDRIEVILDKGIEQGKADKSGAIKRTMKKDGTETDDDILMPVYDDKGNVKRDKEGNAIRKARATVDISDDAKKAVMAYYAGLLADPKKADRLRKTLERLELTLKADTYPSKSGYENAEEVQDAIRTTKDLIASNVAPKKIDLMKKYNVSKKALDKYISLVKDELEGDEEVVSRRKNVLGA